MESSPTERAERFVISIESEEINFELSSAIYAHCELLEQNLTIWLALGGESSLKIFREGWIHLRSKTVYSLRQEYIDQGGEFWGNGGMSGDVLFPWV